ncbi:MAG: ABC transporter substrate-binding protein [Ruminococcaceae bacterium]|nr:ABC transporter substrate-binding protein [Oscillospiraceae bacterium]
MKNLFKRVAAVSLAAVMTLGFAGCNSNGDDSGNAGNGGSAGEGGTLVIGGIGPITGPAAQYGVAVKNGAQLAVDEINANGGVNGMTLKLEFGDDEHDPEKSINAYNDLKDKGMKLLIGTVTSAPCEAVSKEAAKDNMFLLTPSGSSVECITAGDNCYRMCFTDPMQGSIAANYIADSLGFKKIGVIYDSSDSYSTGIVSGFEETAASRGLEIVAKEAFTQDAKTDFSVQIQKISESGAEMLFLPFYYSEAALVIQQAQGVLNIPIFGGDGLDGLIGLLEESNNVALADGVYVMSPYAASSPDAKSAAFTSAYQAKFTDQVNQFAADAYDCVYAVKAALEKAGVKDASISAKDLGDQLKAAMTQIELDGVTGLTKWAANGEPEKAPKVMKIVVNDGKGAYEVLS